MRTGCMAGKMLGVFTILLALLMAAGNAEEVRTDASGLWTYILEGSGATITGYETDPKGDVVVPGEVDGFTVLGIGDYAFDYCFDLTRITLPASVTFVSDFAFGVTPGEHGWDALVALEAIEVAHGNPIYASLDGVLFDQGANMLHTYPPNKEGSVYAVPEGIVSIKADAFRSCGVERISLPDSLISIGDGAFMNSALSQFTVPAGVTSIGSGALSCGYLSSIEVAPGNPIYASLDGVLFDQSAGMLHTYPRGKEGDVYTVPDGIASIEALAFRHSNLTRISLPDSLVSIGDGAFTFCDKLEQITLPDTLRSIGDNAFSYCWSLTEVSIPAGVTSIGEAAFLGASLVFIEVAPENPVYASPDGVLIDWSARLLHTYPIEKTGEEYAVPDGIVTIGVGAFYDNWYLTRVTLPDTVTSIGDYAFCGSSLEEIALSDSLVSIGDWAFWFSNLREVALPDSLVSIGDFAFDVYTIYGSEGSYAQRYAQEMYDIDFVVTMD